MFKPYHRKNVRRGSIAGWEFAALALALFVLANVGQWL